MFRGFDQRRDFVPLITDAGYVLLIADAEHAPVVVAEQALPVGRSPVVEPQPMLLTNRDQQVVEPRKPIGALDAKRGRDVQGKCRLVFRRHVKPVFGE